MFLLWNKGVEFQSKLILSFEMGKESVPDWWKTGGA